MFPLRGSRLNWQNETFNHHYFDDLNLTGSDVDDWVDLGSDAKDLSSGASKPIYATARVGTKPGVYSDGTPYTLEATTATDWDFLSGNSGWTMAIALEVEADGTSAIRNFLATAASSANGFEFLIAGSGHANAGRVVMRTRISSSNDILILLDDAIVYDEPCIIVMRNDGSDNYYISAINSAGTVTGSDNSSNTVSADQAIRLWHGTIGFDVNVGEIAISKVYKSDKWTQDVLNDRYNYYNN